jgi:hypothetical protein
METISNTEYRAENDGIVASSLPPITAYSPSIDGSDNDDPANQETK